MKHLREFEIAHQGLRIGKHNFEYKVDDAFMKHFENQDIQGLQLQVYVDLEKRESMLTFHIALNGTISASCDRCTQMIDLPLAAEHRLYIKFDDTLAEMQDSQEDVDMVFMHRSTTVIHLEDFLYEFIVLSVPYKAACPFDEGPNKNCNMEVIESLNNYLIEEEEEAVDPRWEALKMLKSLKPEKKNKE